jgi:hypothetical protein
MAISERTKQKIQAFVTQLAAEEGEGLDDALFDEIEDRACEVSDACMQQFAEALIQRQAAKSVGGSAGPKCPHCGGPGQNTGQRRREILTRRGPVNLDEPECYCRKCRRSFFPSDASVGT